MQKDTDRLEKKLIKMKSMLEEKPLKPEPEEVVHQSGSEHDLSNDDYLNDALDNE